MYLAARDLYGKEVVLKGDRVVDIARYRRTWTGEDLCDFIAISVWTGLRISDVATFNAEQMRPDGSIRVRTIKSGSHVDALIPLWLQNRVHARVQKHGSFIFGEHTTHRP